MIDNIFVHLTPGIRASKTVSREDKTVGGLLGGHVELEIDGFAYGFQYDDKNDVHIFARKKAKDFNCKITIRDMSSWFEKNNWKKYISIGIPVTADQKMRLLDILKAYISSPPYDYAFFGQRCGSSIIEVLTQVGVLKKRNKILLILLNFYPRQIRIRLIKWARKNNYMVYRHQPQVESTLLSTIPIHE